MLIEIVTNLYDNAVAKLKHENVIGEKTDLGTSYEEELERLKAIVKKSNPHEVEKTFIKLIEILFFSYGHDLMYKERIKADCFMHEPLKTITYPSIMKEVRSLFNEVSVLRENPNKERNIQVINKVVTKNIDFCSMLFLLYVHDWQFPNGWEKLYPLTADELRKDFESSSLTIGEFLSALIEYKCKCIKEVIDCIDNIELRKEYQKKLLDTQYEKLSKAQTYTNFNLPVGYFMNHTMLDFIKSDYGTKSKIILPNK